MKANEFFTQEWGTGFTKATLSEKNGLLEMSMEDIYSTMERYSELRLSKVNDMITDQDFLRFHTGYYGDVVDNIKQIIYIKFTGEELLEYLQGFQEFLASEGESVS